MLENLNNCYLINDNRVWKCKQNNDFHQSELPLFKQQQIKYL
jgi:hypothetical protein